MTTHEEDTLTASSADPAAAVSEPPPPRDDSAEVLDTPAHDRDNPASAAEISTGSPSPTREPASDDVLFAEDELTDLRARWAGVQAAFVDDPQDCVQKADGLVSDLVEQLTHGFTDARSRLEEQWSRGEQASTEDLRLALMHYRAFFERLLSA